MIGAIAGQQGFSPDGKTPMVARAQTLGSAGEQTVLSLTGSGYLIGISTGAVNNYYLKLVLDGNTLMSIADSVMYAGYGGANGMPFMMRFESSLLITHKAGTSDKSVFTQVMYLLD